MTGRPAGGFLDATYVQFELERTYRQTGTGAFLPPSPPVSGALPVSRGIRPVIGPPMASSAGPPFVALPPVTVLSTPVQARLFRGVTPCTCADAAGRAANINNRTNTSKSIDRRIGFSHFPSSTVLHFLVR
jgi:hypothetical protein